MNLIPTAELRKLVEQHMKSGGYATIEDMLTAALHSLDQNEKLGDFGPTELDQMLAEGESSGPPLGGEQVLAELRDLCQGSRKRP